MTDHVMTARDELNEIAELLHDADMREKEAKAEKETVRGPFFDLISEVVREEIPLARKTVIVEIDPTAAFNSESWRAFHYPTWNVVAIQPESDDGGAATRMVVTLEESDQHKKFEFEHGGYKFGRTIRMEGKSFSAEGLFKDVHSTKFPEGIRTLLSNIVTEKKVTTYEVDEDQALKLMAEHPEVVAILQGYMFPGRPTPALIPIKAVKETT